MYCPKILVIDNEAEDEDYFRNRECTEADLLALGRLSYVTKNCFTVNDSKHPGCKSDSIR